MCIDTYVEENSSRGFEIRERAKGGRERKHSVSRRLTGVRAGSAAITAALISRSKSSRVYLLGMFRIMSVVRGSWSLNMRSMSTALEGSLAGGGAARRGAGWDEA